MLLKNSSCRIAVAAYSFPGVLIWYLYRDPYRKDRFLMIFPGFFDDFLAGGEAALAADWVTA